MVDAPFRPLVSGVSFSGQFGTLYCWTRERWTRERICLYLPRVLLEVPFVDRGAPCSVINVSVPKLRALWEIKLLMVLVEMQDQECHAGHGNKTPVGCRIEPSYLSCRFSTCALSFDFLLPWQVAT